ncbi:DHHC palmitoyltransferase-domain-containing protein [Fennellomyces sp. T-0311]|nr:DHHC palmitoyltransferase-domain-containing protein [Fennellomyces sp. T-0311]
MTMVLWWLSLSTYIRLWFTGPGQPLNETKENIYLCNAEGHPRMCNVCNQWKPDRCHHCRQCNQCVLKMDHHCPWIGGCVGQRNHKLFYLFLAYTTSYVWLMSSIIWKPLTNALLAGRPITVCWTVYKLYLYTLYSIGVNLYRIGRTQRWTPLLTGVTGWEEYSDVDIHWVIMLFFAIVFSMVLSGFTGFHSYCILWNKTTIEYVETRPYHIRVDYRNDTFIVVRLEHINLYDDGFLNNWCLVMGDHPWCWLVPSRSTRIAKFSQKVHKRMMEKAPEGLNE